MVHASADVQEVSTAIVRGAFEYQGQKCSAASRIYIPDNLWDEVRANLNSILKCIKMGSPENFTNFINAVIDKKSFEKIAKYIKIVNESNIPNTGKTDNPSEFTIK